MTRGVTAARLAVLIALAGTLPILLLGGIAIEVLRRSGEREAEAQLRTVASLAAARVDDHLDGVLKILRAVAGSLEPGEDAARRLAEAKGGTRGLRWLELVGPGLALRASSRLPPAQVEAARAGAEQLSGQHLFSDASPSVDACVPVARLPGAVLCAGADLSELWSHVGSIHAGGRSGWVMIFDADGRLLASGEEALRGAVAGGERVAESALAMRAAQDPARAPARLRSGQGEEVLAGWARLDRLRWTVVVERPARDALRPVRRARLLLAGISAVALALSIAVGTRQSRRLLGELAAEERWRTAGRIATGVTHDLNHRLISLQHAVKLAERLDPEVLPRLRDLLRVEVGALRGFVDDFADLSREAISAEVRPLDLADLLRSVALTGESYAEHMGVKLSVEVPPALPAAGDRHLLERALLNLVTNAVEASPRGAVVRLRAWLQNGRALLEVRDQGSGIPPERVSRIFDAFSSTKRRGTHLGLGLASVKRVVEAHRGTVRVDSRPGEGATFTLDLPASAEPPRG